MPTGLQALQLSAVSGREVSRSFVTLLSDGLAESSVVRYRASLSALFAWCVREKLIVSNPVSGVGVPKSSDEPTEMMPFTENDLEAVYLRWHRADPHLADVLLVLGWTGCAGPKPGHSPLVISCASRRHVSRCDVLLRKVRQRSQRRDAGRDRYRWPIEC